MRIGVALVGCLVVGCSSGSNVPDGGLDGGADVLGDVATASGPDYASGTRLRAEVYASADGAKQWHGWFDTQLQTSCQVQTAEDGELRCVPLGAFYETGEFADNGCTQPIATANPCDGPPTYVSQPSAQTCNVAAYAIGTKLGALTTIWTTQNGGCQSSTAASMVDYYLVGAKVDPTTFVKETRTREPRGPDLELQHFSGDDGSKQPNGLFDSKRKGACATVYMPALDSYANRCVPSHVGYAEQEYSDSTCKTPAVNIIPPGTCFYASDDVPTVAWIYESITCHGPGLARFAEIGGPQTGPLYALNGTTCAVDTNAPAQWNTTGPEILPSTFPLLSSSQSGQGRIVQNWQTDTSNDQLTVDGFYDTQLGTACDPMNAADDTLRCIPRVLDTDALYLDDQCTNAVYQPYVVPSCPAPPLDKALRVAQPTACGSRRHYYQVGAKIATPSNLWHWNGPNCEANGPVTPTTDYYGLTEVAPTTLAPLTDVKE